jgi:regulator of chromosome condensation
MAKRARSDTTVLSRRPKKQPRRLAVLSSKPSQILDVYVCGDGELGELGLGPKKRNGLNPVNVKRPRLNDLLGPHTAGVVQIVAGGVHAAALTHDSKVLTWGVNDDGALGRDTSKDSGEEDSDEDEDDFDLSPKETTPTPILAEFFSDDASSIVQVVATDSATFALTSRGSVYGWGIFNACRFALIDEYMLIATG